MRAACILHAARDMCAHHGQAGVVVVLWSCMPVHSGYVGARCARCFFAVEVGVAEEVALALQVGRTQIRQG